MADLKEHIAKHLKEARVLQLATVSDNKPWICNVHFYADVELNIYWCSLPTTRHSLEIEKNPHVAIAIKIHEDSPAEKYVIGLSAQGTAEIITPEEMKKGSAKAYQQKFGDAKAFIDKVIEGNDPHKFYKLTPYSFVLFDNKHFKGNPRQEYKV